jgi:hypothetical protein
MRLSINFAKLLPSIGWSTKKEPKPLRPMVELFKHEGHTYYRFPKELNLPLERFSMSMGLMERISSGISGGEMDKILSGMEKALSAGLSNPKNAAVVAAYIHVLRERQNNVIHRDILLNLAATWVVRGDEDPGSIDPDIHKQKLELFEGMCKEASHDFFTRLDIDPLMPLLTMSPQDFQILWEYNVEAQRKLMQAISHLDSHLDTGRKKPQKA